MFAYVFYMRGCRGGKLRHLTNMRCCCAVCPLQKFPGLLKDGAMPEVLIVSEPVAGMCDHFAAAPDMCPMGDAGAEGEQQQEHVHLGMDVGECQTVTCG